jgi:hypothetical protein
MDLSLLENYKTLVTTSLQSIITDLKIQFENQKEELVDKIIELTIKTKEQEAKIKDLTSKLEENDFNEGNYTRVSIISNLNKQIIQLQNENTDLRTILSKNIPLNASLARTSSPVNKNIEDCKEDAEEDAEDEVVDEAVVVEAVVAEDVVEAVVVEAVVVEAVVVEAVVEDEDEAEDDPVVEYKNKVYYLVDDNLYTKKKDGSRGKCVGKYVNGKPKLNKKKKTEN